MMLGHLSTHPSIFYLFIYVSPIVYLFIYLLTHLLNHLFTPSTYLTTHSST